MTYQSATNAWIAYKAQSALGTAASGSGGTILRTTGGSGGLMTKAAYESQEVRRDGMSSRGRHGTRKTSGAYTSELSLGCADSIMAAVMRGAWGSADLALTQADFTSLTTTTSTIVLTSGNPISLGLRVGDVIRLTTFATTANNSKNLRITALSSTTITVAETLVLDASPDSTCTITRTGRVLTNPAALSLTKTYFTIDEYEADTDVSETFSDCIWGSMKFGMQPNGIITFDPSWMGNGQSAVNATGSSPVLTSPTEPTGTPLAVVDATLRVGSSDRVDLTGFELTLDTSPSSVDTIGSVYSPDVFHGDMRISGSFSLLRSDLSFLTDFMAETQYSLHILAVENESEPKDFVSIYIPNFTLGGVAKSAIAKSGAARTQTIQIPAALVGKDERGTEYDATMAKIQVSNAS